MFSGKIAGAASEAIGERDSVDRRPQSFESTVHGRQLGGCEATHPLGSRDRGSCLGIQQQR
jgi:hypothetical protein